MADAVIGKYKLGMLLFIASEATFFVFLIVAYLYFRGAHAGGAGPTAATSLDPLKAGMFTAALLASSATLWLAGRSLVHARHAMVRAWLLATLVLGGIFLVGQGREYQRLLAQHVTVGGNLFGATFFTLTGFHGLHVLLGLVMIAIVFAASATDSLAGPRSEAVEAVSLYWHFVDAVWLVIFAVVYLWIVVR